MIVCAVCSAPPIYDGSVSHMHCECGRLRFDHGDGGHMTYGMWRFWVDGERVRLLMWVGNKDTGYQDKPGRLYVLGPKPGSEDCSSLFYLVRKGREEAAVRQAAVDAVIMAVVES